MRTRIYIGTYIRTHVYPYLYVSPSLSLFLSMGQRYSHSPLAYFSIHASKLSGLGTTVSVSMYKGQSAA